MKGPRAFRRPQLTRRLLGRFAPNAEGRGPASETGRIRDLQIQEERDLYRDLVASQPTGIYRLHVRPVAAVQAEEWEDIYRSHYQVEFVSDRFCEIAGLDREAFQAEPGLILARIHPDDRAGFSKRNSEALTRVIRFWWEGRLIVEGSPRWVHFESTPRKLPDGGALWTGVLTDISERRQREEAFRRMHRLLRQAERIAKVGGWEIDLETNTLYWSEETFHIYELDPASYTPTVENSIQFYAPEWRPVITQAVQRAIETGENFDLDLELLTATGRRLWVHAASQVYLKDSHVIKVQGSFRDITQERQAAEALAANHALLVGIMESLEFPIFSLDRAYCYTSYNQAHKAAMRTLYGSDITLGSSMLDFQVVPKDRATAKAHLDRALAGESFVEEAASGSEGNLRRYFEVSHAPIRGADGEVTGVAVMARDTTEGRRMAAEILDLNRDLEQRVEQRTRQLEISDQELEAFAYTMSHDLKAPLRAINGFADALGKDAGSILSPEGHGHLQRVQMGAERLGRLIDDLLLLSRVGRDDFATIPLDLAPLAEQVLVNLQLGQPERVLVWEIERPLRVNGDPRLLRVLLENLLGNAWKFTAHAVEPHIWVSARRTDHTTVEITIRDNGAGFASAQVGRLFTPFQRLHRTDEFSGSGIGLAIAKRIISRHGGQIRAEGELGKGAAISFTLPRSVEDLS